MASGDGYPKDIAGVPDLIILQSGAMTIPTEPIGSIPRPLKLLEAINREEFIRDLLGEHEREVDYAELLPSLFELQAGKGVCEDSVACGRDGLAEEIINSR